MSGVLYYATLFLPARACTFALGPVTSAVIVAMTTDNSKNVY